MGDDCGTLNTDRRAKEADGAGDRRAVARCAGLSTSGASDDRAVEPAGAGGEVGAAAVAGLAIHHAGMQDLGEAGEGGQGGDAGRARESKTPSFE